MDERREVIEAALIQIGVPEKVAMIFNLNPWKLKYHARYHTKDKWFSELEKYPEPTIEEYVEMFKKRYNH